MAKPCLWLDALQGLGSENDVIEEKDKQTSWYVIQVRTGMEESMCRRIERMCFEFDKAAEAESYCVGLKECFSPKFKTQRKWKGEWQDIEHLLLPGYVIADAENPARLADAIRGIRDLCRLLSCGETYMPLEQGERIWMERQTQKGNRVIPMSFAYKVGEELEISEGPLKGFYGQISRIDRSKSTAYLELHFGQMTIKTKVGLGILPCEQKG